MAKSYQNPIETLTTFTTNRYLIHLMACLSFGLMLYALDYEIFLREKE